MKQSLTYDYPAMLRDVYRTPCLSLYQPTHRQHPDNSQDRIRYRNLVKQMQESLRAKFASSEISVLLKPFEALADDTDFWNHSADGLAVLGAPGFFRVYKLQRPVAELVVVADSFHTKPLMRIVQSADRYQILGLNKHAFKVYEGDRDALDELPLINLAQHELGDQADGDAEAAGHEVERERAMRTYGPARLGKMAIHGTDVRQDFEDKETEAFFRSVDKAVLAQCSRSSGLPLILAALPEHHHLFRSISRNPFLMNESIDVYPDTIKVDALRERAWQLVQPAYLERLARLVEAFGAAKSREQGAGDLAAIAAAAVAGRIETLLIEADRLIPGRIDATSGEISDAELANPEVDDLLDDLGERVLMTGGEVVIVPVERMPTGTGAAAIFRF